MKLPGSAAERKVPSAKMPEGAIPTATGADAKPLLGIFLKIASTLAFFGMVSALKWVSQDVPITEVVFARNFFGLFPILIMMGMEGSFGYGWKTSRPMVHMSRAMVGVSAMACGFIGLKLLPLPDATAIGFAGPLIVVILAALLLKESVRIYRWSAVSVGFVGVLITVIPHLGEGQGGNLANWGVLFSFLGALLAAFAMIAVRKLSETERTATIVLWFTVTSTVLAAFTYPLGLVYPEFAWGVPDLFDGLCLVAVGVFGGLGQILLTHSYRYADASTIAPFDYMNMVWAICFGFVLFAEVPTPEVIVGSLIVIAAGIFVILREHQLGYDRTRARRASTPSKA
ncbi:DMT family transporter [Flexibacterium corallicola]|uniref:DMT family transporter n=1 Tax=Flexibacterium corallicola TaxID=3037259 RepID=UPI00286F0C2F|nr:DMT family transporter [Pseudovibrio sp. M1P-2-3]